MRLYPDMADRFKQLETRHQQQDREREIIEAVKKWRSERTRINRYTYTFEHKLQALVDNDTMLDALLDDLLPD